MYLAPNAPFWGRVLPENTCLPVCGVQEGSVCQCHYDMADSLLALFGEERFVNIRVDQFSTVNGSSFAQYQLFAAMVA